MSLLQKDKLLILVGHFQKKAELTNITCNKNISVIFLLRHVNSKNKRGI